MEHLVVVSTLLFFCIGLMLMAFWIWMIVDCVRNEPSEGNDKLVWIVIILLTTWVGALIYFRVRRPKRIEQYGQ